MAFPSNTQADPLSNNTILILSSDPLGAALMAAMVETLGYRVRFFHPPEAPDDAFKRERPCVALVDCDDPVVLTDETLGRARMRNISVILFGQSSALQRVRQLVLDHELETLLLPSSLDELDDTLRRAAAEYC